MTDKETLQAIEEVCKLLRPGAVEREIDACRGARVRAWAASPAPARSSEHAAPMFDREDRALNLAETKLAALYASALKLLSDAHDLERKVLSRLSLAEAQKVVADETNAVCSTCGDLVDFASGRRLIGDHREDQKCYEYRRRHGEARPVEVVA